MISTKCKGGYIHEVPMSDIEYIGYFYGSNGNENIKTACTRIKKRMGKAPDFLMNAELFDFDTRKAASDVVCCGEKHRLTEGYGIAFPENKKAVFSYKNNVNADDYIGAYPVLVRNGVEEKHTPNGLGGSRGRTALGVSKDSFYIALIPDGSNDATLSELRKAFINAGATEAINLDGGGSTQYYSPLGNHFTGRRVRGFIGVWLKTSVDYRTVKVNSRLRIRSAPSLVASRVGWLYNGDVVTVLETKGTWCRIAQGWVSSLYLKK